MQKFCFLAVTVFMAFLFLPGCSNQNTPEAVLTRHLQARHNNQPGLAYDELSKSDQSAKSRSEFIEEYTDNPFAAAFVGKTSFTITSIETSGNEASASVSITMPDLSGMVGDLFAAALASAFDEDKGDEKAEAAMKEAADKVDTGELPETTTTEVFKLVFEDETWKVNLGWEELAIAKEKAEKVDGLLDKAKSHRSNKELDESLKAYSEAMEIDSESVEAQKGFEETQQEVVALKEQKQYLSKIALYDFQTKYYKTWSEEQVAGVSFKLRNDGDRILNKVEVTVFFKNSDGTVIAEEDYHPVLVSEYSFGDNKPLKPGYIWQMEKDKFYKAEKVPSEWAEGKAVAKITEIEFAE